MIIFSLNDNGIKHVFKELFMLSLNY